MNYYVIVRDDSIDDGACLGDYENLPFDEYDLTACIPLKHLLPEPIICQMGCDNENARVLYDYVWASQTIISEAFKDILSKYNLGECEFIDVLIRDQRGKLVKDPYFLLNTTNTVEWFDREKSEIVFYSLDPNSVLSIENISIAQNIPANLDLFRSRSLEDFYVISEPLRDALEEAELEGMQYIPVEDFES